MAQSTPPPMALGTWEPRTQNGDDGLCTKNVQGLSVRAEGSLQLGNPNLWPLVRHAPFGAPWGGSPGRMGQAAGPHLKLGGDAMCSPRNGETACGDAAPPPRPPLSRSAILGPSPGHPGGARRGGGGGGGPGAGRGGAAGGQAGTRAGTTCAGQGAASRPRARARLRTLVGGPCAPPRPAPGPALPGAVLGAEVLGFPPPR